MSTSLAKLLQEQQHRLDTLVDLLDAERRLLAEAEIDGEALAEIAQKKQARLEQLEAAETLRQRVQQRLSYPAGLAGAHDAARDADCLAAWEQILERTREAERMNGVNGQLIHMRMSQNKRLLDVIHDAAEKTLYGATGQVGAQSGRLKTSV
ncbi:flagellar protein FlgN [Halomonas sp. NO4]|uniref:flagella synthesis protein FlgN n=1 Tax=Halomonas sp. NO4 TaxID=2484813 RepID=UPI0013D1EA33|nr:flagellar protein FlgN [Halomonas sp. NO4]